MELRQLIFRGKEWFSILALDTKTPLRYLLRLCMESQWQKLEGKPGHGVSTLNQFVLCTKNKHMDVEGVKCHLVSTVTVCIRILLKY